LSLSPLVKMAPRTHIDEQEASEPKTSVWRSAWQNNKGACLILLAEISGASMDAMARFLQQGDTKFHPFQVHTPSDIMVSLG
jgi:hypothetical protein